MELSTNNDIRIREYQNAYILPDEQCLFAFDADGHFIENTSKRRVGKEEYAICDDLTGSEECDYVDEEVFYLGFIRSHWGHFMVDGTVRMWGLLENISKGKKILANIEGRQSFFEEWFGLFGIDAKKDIIKPQKLTRYKKIYIPDVSYYPGHYISDSFIAPFRYVADVIKEDLETYDKIYLSRSRISRGSKQLGEASVEKVFAAAGFKVLYPEEIPFRHQIWYYSHCKTLVTTTGTIAHNILFAAPGTELIILDRYPLEPSHQSVINRAARARVQNIPAYAKGSNHENNLMCFTPELKEYCRREGIKIKDEAASHIRIMLTTLFFRIPKAYKLYWLFH